MELFKKVKHIVSRYGKLEQCNLIPNCTEKGQLCTCHYGAGWWWWWWWWGDRCNSSCPSKPIIQQILSQMTNWGKWARQKIMDYLISTQHPVCSQEGRDSFKIHLYWGRPYRSAYKKVTLSSLSNTISLWCLFLEIICTVSAIMYPFVFTFSQNDYFWLSYPITFPKLTNADVFGNIISCSFKTANKSECCRYN